MVNGSEVNLTDIQLQAAEKYSKDIPVEPVVICDSCTKVLLLDDLKKHGGCMNCGNKKVRSCLVLNEENAKQVRRWIADGWLDPLWLELFENPEKETINKDGVI